MTREDDKAELRRTLELRDSDNSTSYESWMLTCIHCHYELNRTGRNEWVDHDGQAVCASGKTRHQPSTAEVDLWVESDPEPPDREAEFATLVQYLGNRERVTAAHKRAADAAVTAVLDSLAAELEQAAAGDTAPAFRAAADRARARIPVPS